MKNIKYLILPFLLLGILSCYEDKGNYDYTDLNTITINSFPDNSLYVGDTLKLYPQFEYTLGDSSNLKLTYEWRFGQRIIGNERALEWEVDTMADAYLVLRVTDPDLDMVYIREQLLRIRSPFTNMGWMVLSEKEGHSNLTYLRETSLGIDPATGLNRYSYKIFDNVYKMINLEELGTKPVKLHEHKAYVRLTHANVLVLQDDERGSVDINGTTFAFDGTLKENFLGEMFPADFHPVNAMYMGYTNVIENYDGRLYTRIKPTNLLFNAGYFIHEPLMLNNEEIRGNLIFNDWTGCKYFLIHDKGTPQDPRNRIVALIENARGDQSQGIIIKVLPTPDSGWPTGFVPLDDLGEHEVVFMTYTEVSTADCSWFMILKDKNGNYLHQEFTLRNENFNLSYPKEGSGKEMLYAYPLPGDFAYENCVLHSACYKENPYIFIGRGRDLYFYNRKAPMIPKDPADPSEIEIPGDGIRHYYSFDSNITGMNAESYKSERLIVGLDNNRIVIMNTNNAKNITDDSRKIYWQPDHDFGRIVDQKYKVGKAIP